MLRLNGLKDDGSSNIPKFGGQIWYVDKGSGSNSNGGGTPNDAFETIGAGFTAMASGDAVSVKAGTYTELGLDLGSATTKDYVEMWCEVGVLIDPASGTALTVSGASCRISGDLKITPAPAGAMGLFITGA